MPSASPPFRRLLAGLASVTLAAACSAPPGSATSGASGASTASGASSASSASASSSASSASSSGTGGAGAAAPLALRVLFVGNSYTFVNDLPAWVQKLGASSGVAVETVASVAVGGATLADQVTSTGAMAKIDEGGWTHVVLQGQSEEPLYDAAGFEANAAILAAEAKKVGAVPVFYETWARKAGDPDYLLGWSGGTPAAMQAGLDAEYQKVAQAAGALLAPVGDAWASALAEDPSIVLFQPDYSHPTAGGTYLIACVFHGVLTGHSPVGIAARPTGTSAADAAALQGVAEQTVGAPP